MLLQQRKSILPPLLNWAPRPHAHKDRVPELASQVHRMLQEMSFITFQCESEIFPLEHGREIERTERLSSTFERVPRFPT